MPKKKNPRRAEKTLPAQQRIAIARDKAVETTLVILFTVLCDKEHADAEILQRVWREVDELSTEITEGRVNIADLKRVLADEYGITIR